MNGFILKIYKKANQKTKNFIRIVRRYWYFLANHTYWEVKSAKRKDGKIFRIGSVVSWKIMSLDWTPESIERGEIINLRTYPFYAFKTLATIRYSRGAECDIWIDTF